MRPDAHAWFEQRTTSAASLADLDVPGLLRAKRRGGHRVSVVLPARTEAATLGPLVAGLAERWVRHTRLVDELLVIDSDSTDDTAAVARAAGADVVATAAVPPGPTAPPPPTSCRGTAAAPARARRCGSRWRPPPATSSSSSTPISSATSS